LRRRTKSSEASPSEVETDQSGDQDQRVTRGLVSSRKSVRRSGPDAGQTACGLARRAPRRSDGPGRRHRPAGVPAPRRRHPARGAGHTRRALIVSTRQVAQRSRADDDVAVAGRPPAGSGRWPPRGRSAGGPAPGPARPERRDRISWNEGAARRGGGEDRGRDHEAPSPCARSGLRFSNDDSGGTSRPNASGTSGNRQAGAGYGASRTHDELRVDEAGRDRRGIHGAGAPAESRALCVPTNPLDVQTASARTTQKQTAPWQACRTDTEGGRRRKTVSPPRRPWARPSRSSSRRAAAPTSSSRSGPNQTVRTMVTETDRRGESVCGHARTERRPSSAEDSCRTTAASRATASPEPVS